MQELTKKKIENMYPQVTIEDTDVGRYIVVYGTADIPHRMYTLRIHDIYRSAEIAALTGMEKGHKRPIIKIIKDR